MEHNAGAADGYVDPWLSMEAALGEALKKRRELIELYYNLSKQQGRIKAALDAGDKLLLEAEMEYGFMR